MTTTFAFLVVVWILVKFAPQKSTRNLLSFEIFRQKCFWSCSNHLFNTTKMSAFIHFDISKILGQEMNTEFEKSMKIWNSLNGLDIIQRIIKLLQKKLDFNNTNSWMLKKSMQTHQFCCEWHLNIELRWNTQELSIIPNSQEHCCSYSHQYNQPKLWENLKIWKPDLGSPRSG